MAVSVKLDSGLKFDMVHHLLCAIWWLKQATLNLNHNIWKPTSWLPMTYISDNVWQGNKGYISIKTFAFISRTVTDKPISTVKLPICEIMKMTQNFYSIKPWWPHFLDWKQINQLINYELIYACTSMYIIIIGSQSWLPHMLWL